ncbi:MAG: ribbon-helix-helix domain-containing protein [Candidatus Nanohaloarchaea archaeon]|nr:ribbon-helix-helix domain-containing protein [Candidatus Nanohaloarchaea archaeon]
MSTSTVSFKATEEQVEEIDRVVEERGYTSRGEFIRELLRERMEPELTEEAIERINTGRKQLREGEGTRLEDL